MTNTSTFHSENFRKTSEIDDSCGLAVVFRVVISGLISLSSPALMRSNVSPAGWSSVLRKSGPLSQRLFCSAAGSRPLVARSAGFWLVGT